MVTYGPGERSVEDRASVQVRWSAYGAPTSKSRVGGC
jgi:hypothetical protein